MASSIRKLSTEKRSVLDLERGPPDERLHRHLTDADKPTDVDKPTDADKPPDADKLPNANKLPDQAPDTDPDDNDNFWKLYVEEAGSEAKWIVNNWNTQLEALLVLAGLFAAVVSAFLIDLQTHLRPDPQLVALNEIISAVSQSNDAASSASVISDFPPPISIRVIGGLWFSSLVITLFGALWGVLSKGWLVRLLRQEPRNPADQAFDRWRRHEDVRDWRFEKVIGVVPILIQVGLVLFLAGLVIQSFIDNEGIGWVVLVLVALGILSYTVVTVLPIFRRHSPFQNPLSDFIPHPSDKSDEKADTESKVRILVSKLNDTTNDEIFCAAALLLDGHLEGSQSLTWYKGVQDADGKVLVTLWKRLNSFAHRVETLLKRSSLSILEDASQSDTIAETFGGTDYLSVEQGIICLRVILNLLDVGVSMAEAKKFPWDIKVNVLREWSSSDVFPPTWRFLALSVNITSLLSKDCDYDKDDIAQLDWASLMPRIFADLRLRSIASVMTCRGLAQGKEKVKQSCALGLAMFVEIETARVMQSPLSDTIQEHSELLLHKDIAENLWSELGKTWKRAAAEVLCQEDEWGLEIPYHRLLSQEFYRDDVVLSIPKIIRRLNNMNSPWSTWSDRRQQVMQILIERFDLERYQGEIKLSVQHVVDRLNDEWWFTRQQAILLLTKLSEQEVFQKQMNNDNVITKLIIKLKDNDEDIRAQSVRALSTFSTQDAFQEKMKSLYVVHEIVQRLTDKDEDVRAEALQAISIFCTHEFYESDIESSIPSIIPLVDDAESEIRQKAVQILTELSNHVTFQATLESHHVILEIVKRLQDSDEGVRAEAVQAVLSFSAQEFYGNQVKMTISSIVGQLGDENKAIRQQTIQILTKLSNDAAFQATIESNRVVLEIVKRLQDSDEDVRAEAVQAISTFSTHEFYTNDIKLSIPLIVKQLDDAGWKIRPQAIQMLTKLSDHVASHETFQIVMDGLAAKITDSNTDVRNEIVRALSVYGSLESYRSEAKSTISNVIKMLMNRLKNRPSWEIGSTLKALSDDTSFEEEITNEIVLPDLLDGLTDSDIFVRQIAEQALSIFGKRMLQKTQGSDKVITELLTKLKHSDPYIRAAATWAVTVLDKQENYEDQMKALVPLVISQLDNERWLIRKHAIQILEKQSTLNALYDDVQFQEQMNTKAIPKLIAKFADSDEDVRREAVRVCKIFGTHATFSATLKSLDFMDKLLQRLSDSDENVLAEAAQVLLELSIHEFYQDESKSLTSRTIEGLINQLKDDKNWSVRRQSIRMLTKLSESGVFREAMSNEVVPKIIAMLTDNDDDVRVEAARALPQLGKQSFLRKAMKSEKAVSKLVAKFTDRNEDYNKVRQAAAESLVEFGAQEFYQSEIKGLISDIIKHLGNEDEAGQQLVIETMIKLSEQATSIFQEVMKADRFLSGLVMKLVDNDCDVSSAATNAVSVFSKPSTSRKFFLLLLVADLNYVDSRPARQEVYNILQGEKADAVFVEEIHAAVCKLLTRMHEEDLSFICKSIAMLEEMMDADLIAKDGLRIAMDKPTRDSVEKTVRLKLIFSRNSTDRSDVVEALLRLVKFEIFHEHLKPAIGGLIEAVGDNDRNVWGIAISAILELAGMDALRNDLIPVVPKLVQKLSGGDEDEEHPIDVIKALLHLADYKEFQAKLKPVVPILTKNLHDKSGIRKDATRRGYENEEASFHQLVCRVIYKLCEEGTVGRDLTAQLTRVLPNMDSSIAEDLLKLVRKLVDNRYLTVSDCIALGSSLRIVSPAPVDTEVQIYKLEMAAALSEGFHARWSSDNEYSALFNTIAGNSNEAAQKKILSLFAPPEPMINLPH